MAFNALFLLLKLFRGLLLRYLASSVTLMKLAMEKILILIFGILCISGNLEAQNKDGKLSLPDSLQYNDIIISEARISGNKLTKDHYILRELDFKLGDTLDVTENKRKPRLKLKRSAVTDSSELVLRMHYSRENIINTKLFMTVDISLEHVKENKYRLVVDVSERHYWWLFPVIKLNAPNFNITR